MEERKARDDFWKEICNPLPITMNMVWGREKGGLTLITTELQDISFPV